MTQLDRLEALEWTAEDRALYSFEWKQVVDALPDLIRVARAAKAVRVDFAPQMGLVLIGLEDLQTALAPLFSEVES